MDAVDPDMVMAAEKTLSAVPGVRQVDSLRLRWIGHRLHAEAELTVNEHLDVAAAHEIAVAAEHELKHMLPKLDAATVHVGPATSQGLDPHEALSHHGGRLPAPQLADGTQPDQAR
jgi:divalent metal cation (Fe/Co/Zn/Cd) transporter